MVTHELVRHRAGTAFSQTSGRYVRSNDVDMFLPKGEIAAFRTLFPSSQRAVREMEKNIAELMGCWYREYDRLRPEEAPHQRFPPADRQAGRPTTSS